MVLADRRGAFALKAMAAYFTQLTASAKTLGIDGADGIADISAASQCEHRWWPTDPHQRPRDIPYVSGVDW